MDTQKIIPMLHARDLQRGWLVNDNAKRFSNYHHAERELVHLLGGWVARIPETAVKILVGTHIWDDAQHLEAIHQRLKELRYPSELPACPSVEYAQFLDALDQAEDTAQFLVGIYRVLKPRLISACQWHLSQCDPLIDEPSMRLLQRIITDETKSVLEGQQALDALTGAADMEGLLRWQARLEKLAQALGDLGDLPLRKGQKRQWPAPRLLPFNRREAGIEVAEDMVFNYAPESSDGLGWRSEQKEEFGRAAHGQVDAELVAAEVMGRNIYEYPKMPLSFHVAMARQVWDEVRHAHIAIKFLEKVGMKFGDFPVTHLGYTHHCAFDLLGRLIMFNRISEGGAMCGANQQSKEILASGGDPKVAEYFDYIFADEVAHVYNGDHWAKHLCGNDAAEFKRKMAEIIAEDGRMNAERAERKRQAGLDSIAKIYDGNDRRKKGGLAATTGFDSEETVATIEEKISGYSYSERPDTMPG
jgi:uncharacterized ferritin-like protein (DUF455 family)